MATSQDLLAGFRTHFHRYSQAVHEAIQNSSDSTVLARLGDDLDEFGGLVAEVSFCCQKPSLLLSHSFDLA